MRSLKGAVCLFWQLFYCFFNGYLFVIRLGVVNLDIIYFIITKGGGMGYMIILFNIIYQFWIRSWPKLTIPYT